MGVSAYSAYSAGKGGGIGCMHTLWLETARYGVTGNTLALGIMESMEAKGIAPTHPNPVGRFGTGCDVGAAIVWPAAEGWWVTGPDHRPQRRQPRQLTEQGETA